MCHVCCLDLDLADQVGASPTVAVQDGRMPDKGEQVTRQQGAPFPSEPERQLSKSVAKAMHVCTQAAESGQGGQHSGCTAAVQRAL